MIIKILFFIKNNFVKFSIFFLFFLYTNSYSQCAGDDASKTICNLQDPANKNINLFSLLGGSPTTGGRWIDNSKSIEESDFDGIVNVQALRNSGVYTYTYVIDPSICTDNQATITLNVGPYTGSPSPNVSACNDMESYSLFLAFDGTQLPPQQNGIWTVTGTSNALAGSTINPKALGVGTYSYTYTIAALDNCPAQTAIVKVSVFRKPESGVAEDLIVCSTDNLAPYKNLNLNDRLTGQDAGGRWTESITNEITNSRDIRIDVENIYKTLGAGTYNFTYTVLSSNPICTNSQTTFEVIIEKPFDFTGSTLVINSDICESQIATAKYSAILKKGPQNVPDGNYDVTYSINNDNTTKSIAVNGDFVNGTFIFDVDPLNLPTVGDYTFTITNIVYKENNGACSNILGTISDVLTIYALPRINNATVKIDPICKGLPAQVEISGDTNLTNGNYRITYNLSGNNTAANRQLDFTFTSGIAIFDIPANLIPNVGTNTVFTITNIINLTTATCSNGASLSKVFTVKPLPNVSGVTINIDPICVNKSATVQLSGLVNLNNITVNYIISGANSVVNKQITVTVNAGNASFVIPASVFVAAGNTTFILNSILDTESSCNAVVSNKTKSFIVSAIPTNPTTNTFVFCKNDLSTIASLTPSGAQYQWFDSVASTTALSTTTLLVTATYYVKEVNPAGCESGRTAVTVKINELEPPTVDNNGLNFCGLDKPTIKDLSDKTTASGVLYWFDARQNGNQIPSEVLLKEGITYYGYNFSTAINCYSDPLEVTVSLSNCNGAADFFVPDGFSPNGDGVNDTFRIPKIEFLYPNFSLEIYNRYGNLLYRGNREKPDWDGKNSDYKTGIDGIAPNGVYFYILNLNKENKKPIQGRLYLNR